VVTGASSGIGLETARALAEKGARVIMVVRSTDRGEAARAEIVRTVPGAKTELVLADLPAGWRTYPAPERLKDLGTGWARSRVSVALSVPSSVIPHERNVLLNPLHPDFARVRLLLPEDFSFDPRMWKM